MCVSIRASHKSPADRWIWCVVEGAFPLAADAAEFWKGPTAASIDTVAPRRSPHPNRCGAGRGWAVGTELGAHGAKYQRDSSRLSPLTRVVADDELLFADWHVCCSSGISLL